ncbi:MAG TPA: DUF1800 domain-containing protein [Fibrobacteria bacterium]|nr:DUF1800 domain-containing protein [Fibrobacteria bacterium]
MDRRTMLAKTSGSAALAKDPAFARHANAALPKRAAVTAGLEPYAGTWDKRHASHLLRRALFGFTKADLDKALSLDAAACVDALLDVPDETPPPPLSTDANDTGVAVGQTWTTVPYDGNFNGTRQRSLQNWWMALILGQKFTVQEKMILFWHNHLATELDVVGDPKYAYAHHLLLRRNAVGNFKGLVRQITLDPAMLQYLNGDSNTNTNPNENYGRELQELFTVGKGPEIAAGNYTNYTEEDVKAAARVLTGWRDVHDAPAAEFQEKKHDAKDKAFSSAYGNAVITGRTGPDAGTRELDDLIALIFAQAETARYFCRKLYRYFVYYAIDATVEKNVIAPLADQLVKAGFEIKPVLATLLKSAHFQAAANQGCQIKTPLDLVAGTLRQLGISLPDGADVPKQYSLMQAMVGEASRMQQEIGNPPNVAGWSAYYQDPVFYEVWINSDTLPRRVQFTDRLASAKGYGYYTDKSILSADVIALAKTTSRPELVNTLIDELAAVFYPIALTDLQFKYLKDVMLTGLPDYEWGVEWDDYLAAPADATKIKPVETRLRALVGEMMQMAEFQLC